MDGSQQQVSGQATVIGRLRSLLQQYPSVAVAFSGGVDSTVLLHNCCSILPKEKVVALHADSCLHSASAAANTKAVIAAHFADCCRFIHIRCEPLDWSDFAANDRRRCYYCKHHTYTILLGEMKKYGCEVLVDGTNTSDLSESRPGLQAARELGVVSPFLLAGMAKSDIRAYARNAGLINHDLPSNSCLATRIRTDTRITGEALAVVEQVEEFLLSLGFRGVRARPLEQHILIELQERDLPLMMTPRIRNTVIAYCRKNGLGQPFVSLSGR